MSSVFSAEFSRRSLYLSVGALEAYGEFRAKDWPRQWSRLREPGSLELWLGRAYVCLSRTRPSSGEPAPGRKDTVPPQNAKGCEILAFKRPVRAA
jgi:hypothetical protein